MKTIVVKLFEKKYSILLLVLINSGIFISCTSTDFKLRLKNQYQDTLINVWAGPASFGTIAPNQETGYVSIPEGSITVTGQDKNNPSQHLTGNLSTSGGGKHRWTMTINTNGTLSLNKDQ